MFTQQSWKYKHLLACSPLLAVSLTARGEEQEGRVVLSVSGSTTCIGLRKFLGQSALQYVSLLYRTLIFATGELKKMFIYLSKKVCKAHHLDNPCKAHLHALLADFHSKRGRFTLLRMESSAKGWLDCLWWWQWRPQGTCSKLLPAAVAGMADHAVHWVHPQLCFCRF